MRLNFKASADYRDPVTHPPVAIKNVQSFLDVVGKWNLYDFEISALRLLDNGLPSGSLEIDLRFHSDYLEERPTGIAAAEYLFVFAFYGVAALELAGFGEQFVVGEHLFESDSNAIYVSLESVAGGLLRFTCTSIELLSSIKVPAEGG